jgi:DNA-binding MarR family transcriptional regulator
MAKRMSDNAESARFRLARSTSHLLHRAQQLAADRFAFLVGENGVTLRQFAVLAAIEEQPGLSQTDLVRATGIDRSTLADMMNRMEKRQLIVRSASPVDGRANAVALAGAGEQILHTATKHARAADAAILDVLPKNKRRAFQSTIELLSALAEQTTPISDRETRPRLRREKKKQKKRDEKDASAGGGKGEPGHKRRG